MSGISQVGGAIEPAAWRQLIDLGARLLDITRTHPDPVGWIFPFYQYSINTAVQIFGGHASLWFAESIKRLVSGNQPDVEFSALPEESLSGSFTPLVKQAFDSGRACLQSGEQIVELPAGAPFPTSGSRFDTLAIPFPRTEPAAGSHQHVILGVLQFQRAAGPAFSANEIDLALGFSTQVDQALQTGLAVGREKRQQEYLELVRQISARIADIRDFEVLSVELTRLIREYFGYYYVCLFTIEPASRLLKFSAGAASGQMDGQLFSGELSIPHTVEIGQGIIGRVAESGHEILVNDVSLDPDYLPVAVLPDTHSEVALPLIMDGRVYGVLDVQSEQTGFFNSLDMLVLRTLSSNLALAFENLRHYEAVHEQAWLSTVLLRVTEATQELGDLNELLDTVIQITPSLAGVKACLLYLKNEDQDFIPAAASGLDIRQQHEFWNSRFSPGDIPALDNLSEIKDAHGISWDAENLPLWRIFKDPGDAASDDDHSMAVLAPMHSHENLLGAFVLEFSQDSSTGRHRQALEAGLDEKLAIVQGIAHQAAVAVENIRLIDSQKEAAYVSVALLQVAQAVVNSADLLEALGAIVRITPILAGVDRAVVFLWEASTQVFRPVQGYGISHDAPLSTYKNGEFPLLEAVFDARRSIAYPLPVDADNFRNAPDDWSFLIPPDPHEIDFLLEQAGRLLLALPLSVKGENLGVLVVEEPLPAQNAGIQSSSNRRLRGKRLEILTGVSQQSALAVQNDILQHELVERERLERELQLARQIQRTFLPDIIPDLPGWDLRVCWRTAREVGGDFYDFFELPGNCLGLVIADVADKGMPAALFMTVVRSLVRASLDVDASPASILERVNNLVVPDAAQGMFVTLAFAVLDLNSGSLEFANAGHNPPLLVRHGSCAIETLERGGMALGVLADNRIQGGTARLNAGDFLVMYTDGVTEAFSPQDDLFGEERLYSTILTAVSCPDEGNSCDAQCLLDAIDQHVSEFIGQASRTDDLTLLVLKRL